MHGDANDENAALSLLDRLIDDAPEQSGVRSGVRARGISAYREGLRRDIEALLNARRRFLRWPERYEMLDDSLLNYGTPDFSTETLALADQRERVRREIERILSRFETRFQSVRVELGGGDPADPSLRFHITAVARVEDRAEPFVFDTAVEPADWSVKVKD